ncbi:amine sulfotransferase-like [Glandiceps talaboti]
MASASTENIGKLDCFRYDGVPMPSLFLSASNIDALKTFEVRDDDVWVVSYPRTGSHWVRNVIYNIVNCDKPEVALPMDDLAPFAECNIFTTGQPRHVELTAAPRSERRIIGSHFQTHMLPRELFERKGKVIYLLRNPKDTALSYYHFLPLKEEDSFREFAENFLDGEVPFGSYTDNIISWWKKKDLCNFYLLHFEELKLDMDNGIRELAAELNITLSDSDVETVKTRCSIEAMKKKAEEMRNAGKLKSVKVYRKGVPGGWKSAFTVALSEKFDKVFADRLDHLNIKFTY